MDKTGRSSENVNKEKLLRKQVLWSCSFQRHKHGATESNKHDKKHHTKASHVPVDDLGQSLGVQACGSKGKIWKQNNYINNHKYAICRLGGSLCEKLWKCCLKPQA